ncbi:MAG TPA: non-ribosomal peptide synthase/polyketide synthase [Thermoanaerobaculia bacterium]|nr:non-ribosomal peptide synthase/polyketide synthase [Thermoanaerobaculia bacterium]
MGRGLPGGGATLYTVLLTAFQTLLHCYGGQDDVLVGSPTTGRSTADLAGLVGYFVNPVVLRGNLSGDPSFAELLARLRHTALDAFAHQDFPFPLLVERLQPERDASRSPIFQALLVLQKARAAAGQDLAVFALGEPGARADLGGLAIESVRLAPRAAQFDVSLAVAETSRGLAGALTYSLDLFDPATAERMARHFATLLAGAAADPQRKLSELPMLTEAEQGQLLAWNATAVEYPQDVCLHDLIARQVERMPDAVAVSFEGTALTYGELWARAGRLAGRLRGLGVGPEVRVGISTERSLELVVGLLAILRAGGAYVPIDPGYPQERIAYLLEDSQVAVLLTAGELADGPGEAAALVAVDPDNLAYVIYTSGSTGRPKGAMNTHRGIVNRLLWMQERYGLTTDDRVLQKTPFSFDVSVWEFFWPLLVGARLVVARPGGHQDPAYLVETIRREGITTLHFVPSMLQVFLEAPGVEECRSLKRVIASGEALPPELEQRFFARLGTTGAGLFNLYGPTEAAVDVTHWDCSPGAGRTTVPIGLPVANTTIHLVGRHGEPVPVGVAGELLIGGVQVARGYLGRPKLTAERFVPDPFGGFGARVYRTGDLARRRPDGAIEYLGRLDHQVKIRGFRIELGEIEAALASHPEVREAVVMARSAAGDQRLVAWVVGRESAPDGEGLRRHLARALPEYMVPSAFVVLEAMPLSPNGKVDRKALPEPEGPQVEPGRERVAPRTELERRLVELWREVLQVEEAGAIGIHDNFFEIGGNSLRGASLINRLQELLGEIVHVVALFDAPTVARLSALLEEQYPAAVARLTGTAPAVRKVVVPTSRVDAPMVVRLRELLRADRAARLGSRNRSAVFVLSPPRSGSTLLRVMLGGHSRLFAPPELELLSFHTLAERQAALAGRDSFRLEGLTRAVMEVRALDAGEAARLIERYAREGWTTQRFYGQLQEWLGDRLLVDKTPSYALDLGVLTRAEEQFEEARYIHLVRHPCGMICSFEESRLDQGLSRVESPFSRRQLAELVWVVSHENIDRFLAGVPAERQHLIRFENLVSDPARVLERLCAFLGVELQPDMLDPYIRRSERMTDGLHRESRMLGDVKFHQYAGIEPAAAERWREHLAESSLGEITLRLAATLGYRRTGLAVERADRPSGEPLPLSFSQERLWLLDRIQPGTSTYNMPAALRVRGKLDVAAFRAALTEIVRRHEALRTTFTERAGRPVQVVAATPDPRACSLPIIDLSALPRAQAREPEARRLAESEARQPFDLAGGPLLRTALLRLEVEAAAPEHVLLLTLHHIVSDGWSMGILLREVTALYSAFAQGRPSPLPELPLQYPDFALWQHRWLAGEVLRAQLDHWREKLAGAPLVLKLPTDGPRPPVQGHRGGHIAIRFPEELTAGLAALAREGEGTLFMLMLAGVSTLLHRYSGQEDLLIGSPIAGRTRAETEGLIGCFVNTLVFRSDVSGDPSVRELLARTRAVALAAYDHQDLPFEKLVEALQPVRDPSRSPVVQVLLAQRNPPVALELAGGLRFDLLEIESGTSKFDLAFSFFERGGGLEIILEYDSDLWGAATARRMLGHLQTLLAAAVEDPRQRLSRLPLLTGVERAQLLEWREGPRVPFAGDRLFHQLVADQAARAPQATAVVAGEQRLSYGELDARANRLAGHLRALGVGPDVLVGLAVERSPEMVVAVLGILKAGGAYLPLDPGYPRERLELMVADAGPRVLLTQERFLPLLPGNAGQVVCLDRGWEDPASWVEAAAGDAGPDNLVYVIYTSGSTGRPKGVAITHRGLVHLCLTEAQVFAPGEGDRVLQFASLNFDASVFEMAAALASGAELHLAERDALLPGPPLLALLRDRAITSALLPPTALAALPAPASADLPALRALFAGGEACPEELARSWAGGRAGRRFFNAYGPTEVTVWATVELFAEDDRFSIGRPVANARVCLLDRNLESVPVGVPGEVFVGGPGLARGYLGRPALTAERFVPDPSDEAGERLYRTGDLARWLPDGRIDFLGRADHQVKIRGFRIELEEIEAALATHPGVREVAVMAREGERSGDRRLVAWVVPREGVPAPEIHELRRHLARTLPEYMVPAAFVFLQAMPLTPSGKVDRRALPAPEGRPEPGRSLVAPRTNLERLLIDLWRQVLPTKAIGIHDGFFELGGHSMLAAHLVFRLQEHLGESVPLAAIFQAPTVAELGALLEERYPAAVARLAGVAPARDDRAIRPAERQSGVPLPLSFAQERLWFLEQLQPGTAAYNVPAAVRLEGHLAVPLLAACLDEIVRRHEALRTTFRRIDGRPAQVIVPPAKRLLPIVDLAALDPARREVETSRLLVEDAERPFDLATGPLLRSIVLRLGPEEHLGLFSFHHIVTDGWSTGVLMGELAALYPAVRAGRPSPLPELPVQYADFAQWQRSSLQGEILAAQLDFWREYLAGAPLVLDLPTDRPRPARQSFRGRVRGLELPAGLSIEVRELARRERCTLFIVLLTAFSTMLHRISGQDDLVVGTPVANRTRAELERLIGFFVNSLALRADLSGNPGFRQALERVRQATLGAYTHQDLPFEKLVGELQPERDLSRSPIFQVMLVQNAPRPILELPGLTLRPLEALGRATKLDLMLELVDSGETLSGGWNYSRDLFDATTVDRLTGQLQSLIAGIVAHPELPLSELPLLTKREQAQLLEWNATATDYPLEICLHELVAGQVEWTPNAVAVSFESAELTYGELWDRAGRLARRLRGLGVGPDVRVGISAERSLELVVGLLAILRAGGAYVPIDPGYPRERIDYLLEDSRVAVLLTREDLLDREEDGQEEAVPVMVDPDNLAYVIYTSGSTGRPKGTMNTHRGIVNRLLWMQERYGLDATDRVLQKTPFSFDVSVWEFFWPLITGARLVVARPGGHQDPTYLVETIVREGITTLHFVPSMLQVFLEAPGVERCRSLSRVVASGEALPPELEQRFFARLGTTGAGLFNLYGPTEAAVDVTHWDCSPAEGRLTVPIGRPVANTAIHLLGRHFEPVPVGVPGELFIGGVQVARGYLGRPELTAERFLPDPFGEPGARLYRTGDLTRRRPDGAVEYLGRLDHQVKIRGFRIELGEIEAALATHPAVREAVVLARGSAADQRLVAWVVGREGAPEIAELRRYARRTLPEYMVPSAFVVLDAMPLSPNGKVDRKALPDPESRPDSGVEAVAPRTDLERLLARLWREILQINAVGVHDNFFELGGNSLLGATLIYRLQEHLGENLHVAAIFEAPTVAQLATLLESRFPAVAGRSTAALPPEPPRRRETKPPQPARQQPPGTEVARAVKEAVRPSAAAFVSRGEEVAIRRGERQPGTPIPLSFSQERLWFLDRMHPGSSAYNMPGAVRLRGTLDVAALRAAVTEIVRRHEALRTTFGERDGSPYQVVAPDPACSLPIVDLGGLPPDGEGEREAELLRLAVAEARRPFDLAAGPLLRTTLLRLDTGGEGPEHVLFLTMHHIVSDGWSMGIFLRELAALYGAFAQGQPSPLPELSLQYPDFALWQRGWLAGEVLEAKLASWRERLAGAPVVLELPTDRPRPPVQKNRGGHLEARFPLELAGALATLARQEGVTLFMALLAGVDALACRYSGQDDLLLGSPFANRSRFETEELIGFFVNTLVLRSDLSGDPSVRELLGRVRASALAAYAHQELPFEKLVEVLQPVRDPSRSPLFQVMLVLQNASVPLELPGLQLDVLDIESGASKFDLTFSFFESGGTLRLVLEYDRDLWDAATARRIIGHLETLLAAAAADPGCRLSRLPLLTGVERAQLQMWNQTRTPVATGRLFHQHVADRAARTPEATALVFGEQRISYGELDARAGRLARHLRALGVGPDVLVGLAVERSPEMVVGVLGVLQAGGAFLPLDPSYPRERLELMIADAGPRVLLTQERLLPALPDLAAPVVCLDREEDLAPLGASGEGGATLDNLAYVIYTSGSTGRPKGVGVTHRGLLNLCAAQIRTYATGPQDRVLQFASPSFDASVAEITIALRVGAELHLASREEMLPGPSLLALLRDRGITNVTLPPRALAVLPALGETDLPELRTLLVAGEACPVELARSWSGGAADRRVFNAYGPTEATVWATVELFEDGRRLTIGRPIANTRVHLLDRHLEEVPVGVPGEVFLAGDGLARGYLGRPDLTAGRFVPDPFGEPGARLYRTGDLARHLPDGRIDYLGRVDHQVKIRGFRIELGEIEALLAGYPAVAEAVVVAREDVPGDRRLVAYVVPAERGADPAALTDELAAWLGGRLPAYMVPSALVVLEALPLSPNGKVDRRGLPAPQRAVGRPLQVAARTPVEELLAGIWCQLLGLERVGVEESFFALGGHSLLATRLASRVRETFGVELPVRRLFEAPTVAALAQEIEAARAEGERPELPPVRPVPHTPEAPLSFPQERLWFLEQMQPGSVAYSIPGAVRLLGDLDVAAFRAALTKIARRHEALRTTFALRGGGPVQVISPQPALAIPLIDLGGLPGSEAEALRLGTAEAARPFDLTAGPLLRCALLRLSAGEHVALLNMHHIVSDGWSMGVLVAELGALYAAFTQGRPSPLPNLPVQYPDFAIWQRGWLAGEALEAQLAYWREALAGAPGVLELPADRPRPAAQSFRGGSAAVALEAELSDRLVALGRERGVTLFMTLLAGFQAVLSWESGQRDLVVGTPVANRTRSEIEGLIGFFVNTLAVRGDLSGDPPFLELLGRVRERALSAYAHQDLPFEKLVEELQPERSLAHSPLFQVLFVLQNASAGPLELPGLRLAPVELDSGAAKFDLTLSFTEEPGGIQGLLQYSRDLFDAATAERLLGHLRTLLAAAAADPGTPVPDLPLLTPAEQQQIAAWNRTDVAYPEGSALLHELIARQVAQTPRAVAVSFEGRTLTFRQLDERAGRLARCLRRLGVGPEVRVGICAERSLELVIGLLGILQAGGAYVPIDPSYPVDRLAYMLESAEVPVLLTQRRFVESLPEHGARVVCLDEPLPRTGRVAETDAVRPGNLAYVIYTSGSTGRPKGAMNSHRGIVNRLLWMQEAYGLTPDDRVLQKTPFSFDVSVWEFFWPLLVGARLVVARPGGHQDPAYLVDTIVREGITTMHFVPSMLQAFVEEPGVERCTSLKRVIVSGEALPFDLQQRFFARLGAELHNLYGPTEAAVDVTYWVCERDGERRSVPIGRPVANTRIHLLDSGLRPVPVRVVGELWIGGVQVGRGYLGRPELTAERFIPDPFSAEPGARLYRTGDLARYGADGAIEYNGRIDHQVKIRGLRIELGEIEAALNELPGVRESVVMALEREGEKRLAAFVAGEVMEVEELRRALGDRLPEYMVPTAFVILDALPLSPNGKADRKALAGMAADVWAAGPRAAFVPPRNPMEELVAGVWADLLGSERIGAFDNFFELGGHSLLAARVMGRLREALGVDLPLRRLFEAPTVAALTAELASHRTGSPAPPIPSVPRNGDMPLSPAQERLWFLDQLEPVRPWYNLPSAVRLRGRLDVAALARSIGEIVRRHEALRTVFATVDDRPVQVVRPAVDPATWELPVIDLRASGDELVEPLAAGEAWRPFDLAAGPLLRALLLRLDEEDHALLLTMHHIVSDGWSMGVFLRELAALYGVFLDGRPSPLSELPVQYADFATWQRRWLSGEILDGQLAWWRERLAGAPEALDLPTDHPRPPVWTARGGNVPLRLSAELSAAVAALGRRTGTTLFMTLLAAWTTILSRYGAGSDVVVGSPVAGRVRPEVEGLIGFFVNTLPLRTDLSGDPSFRELLARVREGALDAWAHQDVPFERLVEALQPVRDPSRTPLFQVMLALQNAPAVALEMPGLALEPLEIESRTAKFDLTLSIVEQAGALTGSLEINLDLFDPATAERMVRHLRNLLQNAATDPEQRLAALPLLDPEELEQVVSVWNQTAIDVPSDRCIHEIVEAIARRRPEAVALSWTGGSLTYGELDEAANRLARHLARLGVGIESRVGVCLERSPKMIVALLAILKTGGAYLPLDPGHPAERLSFIREDAGLTAVLASEPEVDAGLAGESAAPLAVRVDPDNLAYAIYTSGSTGTPKGTELTHRGLLNLVAWHLAAFDVGEGDRCTQVASPAFDASVWEIWTALAAGATLCLPPEEVRLEAPALLAWLAAERVTVSFLPTPLAEAFLAHLEEGPEPEGLALRVLLTGGDRLRRAPRAGLPFRLVNNYGPTESTVVATSGTVEGGEGVPSIGRPIHNTRVLVLDRDFAPVPVGVPGELLVGGLGLARGYLARPALTSERFVPDPFSGPGARLYRTGDLVRWSPSGTIEFLGRIDFQVKVRGLRIEMGEIEAVLAGQPGVREAVVIAREDRPGQIRLVAFVVPQDLATATTPVELGGDLRRRLPDYMIPSAFVLLEALPLSPNGKVDRRSLSGVEVIPQAPAGEEPAAPRTPTEELLAGLWAEVLGLDRVGVHDDFFELGGHSLLATRLASRIRSALRVEMPLGLLFERPTVAGLAAALESAPLGEAAPPIQPAPRGPEGDELSFAQQRLWFLDRLEPGSSMYNIPVAFRLRGRLDAAAWTAALGEVVRRHEALRTTFGTVDGTPVQRIAPPRPFTLPVVDLRALPEALREEEAARLAEAEARRPFDLAAGPLGRFSLLRLEEDDHLALLTQHHIVSDGWSMGVLLGELAALYRAAVQGEPSPLPELPVQYADFARGQRQWLRGEALERRLVFWRERLAGVPVLDLPTDRPRPPVQTFRGAARSRTLPALLGRAVAALGRREGTTLFMTLLAAFQASLQRTAGQDDFAVGSPIAGRNRREIEGLIGFFVNTLVLRAGLGGNPSFRELLTRVREMSLAAFAHQDVPFERLVEELAPERDLGRSPLFQVSFVLQEAPRVPELPDLLLEPVEAEKRDAKFDLGMAAADRRDGLGLALAFNTDLFDAVRIERMLGHFETLLEAAVESPERQLSELPLLSPAERYQLLVEWSSASPIAREEDSPVALFETWAARTPEAVALTFEGERLTYGELDALAEDVARRLQALGVGPEDRVGLCLERSFRLIAALLGVLKAGGAYVPLDPSYPRERLAYMLEDSGIVALLTETGTQDALPPHDVPWVLLDGVQDPEEKVFGPRPASGAHPDNAAYVIYTSGSTGTPKGVVNSRRALSALLTDRLGTLDARDRVLHKSPISFDASIVETFAPLAAGARVVLARPGGQQDAAYLVRLIEREGVTVIGAPPALLTALLEQKGLERCHTLRRLAAGTEAVPYDLADRFRSLGVSDLYNVYGPTETTVLVLEHRFGGPEPTRVLPIGRPIAGTRVYLLDAAGSPVPTGVPGELHLGGPLLARGYLNRPGLTAERYVPDPFTGEPGARLYRTGDLVRYRGDGAVEFVGRVDRQVKVRGFRVELGEIETALAALPGMAEVAVVDQPDRAAGGTARRLVAFLVLDGAAASPPVPAELRAFLADRLPAFMVPSAFVVLEALPLTPNGKVDRAALSHVEPAADLADGYLAPRDTLELRLARIWEELLGVERVGVRDSFFELGGHSLLAVRLMARIARLAGRELPLSTLFQAPTVEQMARLLRAGEPSTPWTPLVPLREAEAGSRTPFFCVHPIGGSVFCYRDLAGRLGADQPFYGLQARGLSNGDAPHCGVSEMAAEYLAAIRTVQPHGPYLLGGWSFGALVALEMARQLEEKGERVGLLALIDAAPAERDAAELPELDEVAALQLLAGDLAGLAGRPLEIAETELASLAPEERPGRLLERATALGLLPPDLSVEQVRHLTRLYQANARAMVSYALPACDSRITLLLGTESPSRERVGEWRRIAAGDLEVLEIPGDHYTLLREPRVGDLAAALRSHIDRAQEQGDLEAVS